MEWRTLINQVEEGLNKAWKGDLRFAKDKSMELKAKVREMKKKNKIKKRRGWWSITKEKIWSKNQAEEEIIENTQQVKKGDIPKINHLNWNWRGILNWPWRNGEIQKLSSRLARISNLSKDILNRWNSVPKCFSIS